MQTACMMLHCQQPLAATSVSICMQCTLARMSVYAYICIPAAKLRLYNLETHTLLTTQQNIDVA